MCISKRNGNLTRSLEQFPFTFPRDKNHYERMRGGRKKKGSQIESNIHLKQMKTNIVKEKSHTSRRDGCKFAVIFLTEHDAHILVPTLQCPFHLALRFERFIRTSNSNVSSN